MISSYHHRSSTSSSNAGSSGVSSPIFSPMDSDASNDGLGHGLNVVVQTPQAWHKGHLWFSSRNSSITVKGVQTTVVEAQCSVVIHGADWAPLS